MTISTTPMSIPNFISTKSNTQGILLTSDLNRHTQVGSNRFLSQILTSQKKQGRKASVATTQSQMNLQHAHTFSPNNQAGHPMNTCKNYPLIKESERYNIFT